MGKDDLHGVSDLRLCRVRKRQAVKPAFYSHCAHAALGRKSGVAPAQSSVFFCVTFLILVSFISSFTRTLSASQGEEGGEDEAE
jgi:hypothetical protein